MSRYDKYEPKAGGFRAVAKANNTDASKFGVVQGASIASDGLCLVGDPGSTGFKGVTIVDRTKRRAGDVLDVMTNGEIVDLTGLQPGTTYYLDATTGALTTTAGRFYVGHTVEAWRLIVRFQDQKDA